MRRTLIRPIPLRPHNQRSSALAPIQTRLRAQLAVFLWEGVIMYLDRPAIESTLRKIASG
jgi:O-methyltransferase involved in polyketide biosynthesis